MQPTRDGIAPSQFSGTSGQYHERCLKGVIGFTAVTEQPVTYTHDERGMAAHECCKGRFITSNKSDQEFSIVEPVGRHDQSCDRGTRIELKRRVHADLQNAFR